MSWAPVPTDFQALYKEQWLLARSRALRSTDESYYWSCEAREEQDLVLEPRYLFVLSLVNEEMTRRLEASTCFSTSAFLDGSASLITSIQVLQLLMAAPEDYKAFINSLRSDCLVSCSFHTSTYILQAPQCPTHLHHPPHSTSSPTRNPTLSS